MKFGVMMSNMFLNIIALTIQSLKLNKTILKNAFPTSKKHAVSLPRTAV